uniref:ABC transporter domain-containing protein n=1 Tax=Eucampia antarctica TaxID=49252 RepID=A0A7S2R2P1_9STRA|mmetsp:Transcript_15069/g.14549  ORF Transcript_15069/g.14549 Transcript_15069/m.14549 type:complete len:508 (+) Transcript_15069:92-1615(+)
MTNEICVENSSPSEAGKNSPGFLLDNRGHAIIQQVVTNDKVTKTILRPMDIAFPDGKLTAIMGPSGCGKSTLLDLLTGSIAGGLVARGEVFLPGKNAYVPQGDRLHGFYTCHSYMRHYARLSGMKLDEATNQRIDDILEDLGLAAHKDTRVGDMFLSGLSGGQKRRLSVALEALSNPQNLFLDEPTSGLDAESAYQVMKYLHKYVQESPGRRIILTIHQPSSFIWQMLDNVVLLSKGFLVYQGSTKKMESFFESCGFPTPDEYNPADHYVTVTNDDFKASSKQDPESWASNFQTWSQNQNYTRRSSSIKSSRKNSTRSILVMEQNPIETKRGDVFNQIIELVRRYFTNILLNPGIIGVRVVMYAMLALIIGALFWKIGDVSTYTSIQSRIALAFFCAAFFVFMSVAVMPFILIERGIVEKEVRNGYYHPAIYQLAQAINSIPGCALLALVTTLIIVPMTGFREPYLYFLTMLLALMNAEALNQLVSYMVPHFIIGIALVAGVRILNN